MICSFPQCDRPVLAIELCTGHYTQRRKGKPLTALRFRSPNGQRSEPKRPEPKAKRSKSAVKSEAKAKAKDKVAKDRSAGRRKSLEEQLIEQRDKPRVKKEYLAVEKEGQPVNRTATTPNGWFIRISRHVMRDGKEHAVCFIGGDGEMVELPVNRTKMTVTPKATTCTGPSCNRVVVLNNLCDTHLQQCRKQQPLTALRVHGTNSGSCAGPQCTRAAVNKGYCTTHSAQIYRGRPLTVIHARGGKKARA